MSGRKAKSVNKRRACNASSKGDEVAAYAFDLLQSLRRTCSDDDHRFLSYLIGMAAEEAQRLSEGQPSAGAAFAKAGTSTPVAKKH
jgi:hypothetical protein